MRCAASRSRDDGLQVPAATQLDVSRPSSPQQFDTKSSSSVTSSSSSSHQRQRPGRDSVTEASPSRRPPLETPTGSDVMRHQHQRQRPGRDNVTEASPSRRSPLETPTGSDVMGQPRGLLVASPLSVNDDRPAEEQQPNATSGPPLRRRAVNLSDLRSCALVQTQLKTRNASATWR